MKPEPPQVDALERISPWLRLELLTTLNMSIAMYIAPDSSLSLSTRVLKFAADRGDEPKMAML